MGIVTTPDDETIISANRDNSQRGQESPDINLIVAEATIEVVPRQADPAGYKAAGYQ
jgi:hypothetical protein